MANPEKTPDAHRGFFVNVGSLVSARGFLAISQLLVLPIMARQLSVAEFAIMAMAMSIVVFSSVLSDAGLGRSLIRSPTYDRDEWSSVFWLLAGIGVGLCLCLIAISPLWAKMFNEPRLIGIVCVLSVVPLMQALSAAHNAHLERNENYTSIAGLQAITTIVSLGLAVALAFAGAGVWALVAQQLALASVRLFGIVWLSDFQPALTFKQSKVRPHLTFARDSLLVSLISAVQNQSGVIAIGRFLGEGPLGLFSMSERFSRLPQYGFAGPMSSVVYVRMAKAQDNLERVVEIYLAAMRLMGFLLLPVLLMIAACGTSLFTLLLSDTWTQVAPIFAWSVFGLTLEAVAVTLLGSLFRALGRTEYNIRLALESAVIRVLLVVVFAQFSIILVAAAMSIWGLLIAPRGWMLARQLIPLEIAHCLRSIAVPLVLSGVAWGTHALIGHMYQLGMFTDVLLAIGLGLLVMAFSYMIDRKHINAAVALFRS